MRCTVLVFAAFFALAFTIPLPAQQNGGGAQVAPAPGLTLSTVAWPDGDDIPL